MRNKKLKTSNDEAMMNVCLSLRTLYEKRLLPVEQAYMFHKFHSPALGPGDFTAKPSILLLGQYSTGKTTFIRHLLGEDFPGIRIGPEPTTDGFIIVTHDKAPSTIPGNALVVDSTRPYGPLSRFGNAFLNRLTCSLLPNSVLESLTIIDTPGILSGEKQRVDRGYDYSKVIEWFAEHVDRIILLFDAHKLDISDEFKRVIESLRNYDEKIRIVLNKADHVDTQQLMRVYGALMWGLGKVLGTPEVARVYIGSFWDKPLHFDYNRRLFELEEQDLFNDLNTLPSNATLRKLNDFIRRARLAKVHAHIISRLRGEMPSMFGKEKKKKALIDSLPDVFNQISRDQGVSIGDFPKVDKMRMILEDQDFTTFHSLKEKLLSDLDKMLSTDIPKLMQMIPKEKAALLVLKQGLADAEEGMLNYDKVRGGIFEDSASDNPFMYDASIGLNAGKHSSSWIVDKHREPWDRVSMSTLYMNFALLLFWYLLYKHTMHKCSTKFVRQIQLSII
ncbi:Dynamin [Cichlidogyrus casuarinus]|uniref:Dynamin n=1 Tax=Cichlidogyrus casuarinus TaxID=1844966 RepID=A0ABD2Q778_9PLAT